MTIELAVVRPVLKPWGRTDLRPFYYNGAGQLIGELWFTRSADAPRSALLLKLLFTSQPLSIQVHPTDAFARSMGLSNGKSEAWIILDAAPGAAVALGLRQTLLQNELRAAIEDGSILGLVAWRPASIGDIFRVPAGTIHAIGAGLVLAEIQQNSDTTFRLFDFGRGSRPSCRRGCRYGAGRLGRASDGGDRADQRALGSRRQQRLHRRTCRAPERLSVGDRGRHRNLAASAGRGGLRRFASSWARTGGVPSRAGGPPDGRA